MRRIRPGNGIGMNRRVMNKERKKGMNQLERHLSGAEDIIITGHVRPDGDCVGACLGMYHYIRAAYPDKKAAVYLEPVPDRFSYLPGVKEIVHKKPPHLTGDLLLCLDSSDRERLGEFSVLLEEISVSLCIDHHITNTGFCRENIVDAECSSTCELLSRFFREEYLDEKTAACLFTGIVHDTGVFRYSNVRGGTLEAAARMIEKGVEADRIISESFFTKTNVQNQILGRALLESILFLDGACIFSAISRKTMEFYGVTGEDMDGIVEILRDTKGVEVSIFLYEQDTQEYKVSLRSKERVDVSRVASHFGGGGHIRAAGCIMNGHVHDIVNNLSARIALQLKDAPT